MRHREPVLHVVALLAALLACGGDEEVPAAKGPLAMELCGKLEARGVVSDCHPIDGLPKDPKDNAGFSTPTNMGGSIMHYPSKAAYREATKVDLGVEEWLAPKILVVVSPNDVPEPAALSKAIREVLTEYQGGTAPTYRPDKPVDPKVAKPVRRPVQRRK